MVRGAGQAGRSSPGLSRAKTERRRAARDSHGQRADRLALAGCELGGGPGPAADDGKLFRTRSEIIRPRQKKDNIQNTSSEQV